MVPNNFSERMSKTNIDDRYIPEDEIRKNRLPYMEYRDALHTAFDLNKFQSFCDVGCANGPLLKEVLKVNRHMNVLGLEYFPWQKEAADEDVKNKIEIFDLRDEWVGTGKYDIVNCTETGEHIDPEYAEVFLSNIKKLCSKYVVMSWSEAGGVNDREHDDKLQHLNPLSTEKFEELMVANGFEKQQELTKKLLDATNGKEQFYFWWRKSLSVWTIK